MGKDAQSDSRIAAGKRETLEILAERLVAPEFDPDTYREFARYFGPRFKNLFRHRGLTHADAEDLAETCVSDILLKVTKYRIVENGSFESWVFKLARNALSDWFEKQIPTVSLSSMRPHATGAKMQRRSKASPDLNVIAAVRDAVARLSEADQQLIKLRNFISDHTFEEVSKELGVTSVAARVRHHRAMQSLKAILQQDPRMSDWLKRAEDKNRKDL